MAQPKQTSDRITTSAYLAGENDGTWRHEFVTGRVFAMAGASQRHNVVRLNVAGLLNAALGEPCQVFDGDMKLLIERQDDVRFYYPDVFVSCDPGHPEDHVCREAVLVIEVLSPSTARTDRYEKIAAYTSLPMLSEYALIEQDVPSVEVFRRRTGWLCEEFGPGASVSFESIGQTLSLEQIYRRVRF